MDLTDASLKKYNPSCSEISQNIQSVFVLSVLDVLVAAHITSCLLFLVHIHIYCYRSMLLKSQLVTPQSNDYSSEEVVSSEENRLEVSSHAYIVFSLGVYEIWRQFCGQML